MKQCHTPGLVAVTKFKTTKISFEGLFGLSTKISMHENYLPYGIDEKQLCDGSSTNSGEDDKEEDSEVNITGEVLFNQ